ncbi:MAG: UbiA prenyltransferase family protein, partial [Chloroflexi bacterium]|nr:UbiA prenyltransferase family protein [Chloroflexota bacterium]
MSYLIHLRLPFQVLLSPIFLWAYLMADGKPSWTLAIAYVAFHLFGYAGGTAFNSFYDRDEGPVGGLAVPPPVPAGLLVFSLAWQAAGFALALMVGVPLAAIYAIMFSLSVAYSHPAIRWKGKPLLALLTVPLGQGVLACLGGWAAARNEVASAGSLTGLLSVSAATLITTGFYPLTEIYQMDEDARRGDRTAAIWLGPRNAFRWALALLSCGALLAFLLVGARYGWLEAALLAAWVSAIIVAIRRWS